MTINCTGTSTLDQAITVNLRLLYDFTAWRGSYDLLTNASSVFLTEIAALTGCELQRYVLVIVLLVAL